MSYQRAQIENRIARLNTEFGLTLAMRKFELTEADIEKIVGRYKRGKHKGELKGAIAWKKCVVGGWKRNDRNDRGGVVRPGSYDYKITDAWDAEKVKWSETFASFGWLPGETREEYAKRKGYKLENVGAGPAP
jgi:hypothetical protein